MNRSPVRQRQTSFLPYLIMGMSDGLIVPLSIAAVLTSTQSPVHHLLIAVAAVAAGGALLTAIGGYHAVSDNDFSNEAQRRHAEKNKKILATLDLPAGLQHAASGDVEEESEAWQQIIKNEAAPDGRRVIRPVVAATVIALTYLAGGMIILLPFTLLPSMQKALLVAAITSLVILIILGYKKHRLAGMPGWQGALILFFAGLLAAGGAYAIARLFT
ncbi:MAG TPA: VIT1/CCC1 transporter family protein [Chitinophagaceae bacterium]|nr:VIT1/CCC1 transporter family protein [Chitinophagaceae bacterium]